jgi:hypothetical protein
MPYGVPVGTAIEAANEPAADDGVVTHGQSTFS